MNPARENRNMEKARLTLSYKTFKGEMNSS